MSRSDRFAAVIVTEGCSPTRSRSSAPPYAAGVSDVPTSTDEPFLRAALRRWGVRRVDLDDVRRSIAAGLFRPPPGMSLRKALRRWLIGARSTSRRTTAIGRTAPMESSRSCRLLASGGRIQLKGDFDAPLPDDVRRAFESASLRGRRALTWVLDTHVVVWLAAQPERLRPEVVKAR